MKTNQANRFQIAFFALANSAITHYNLEARSQKPEARSQKPEARSQKPEARSQNTIL
jgi:hypothetical protein